VLGQHPALLEAERVDQLGNPLTSGQLAGVVLLGVALLTTSGDDLLSPGAQLGDPLGRAARRSALAWSVA